ncbi:MAG TPA: hypothetical protein VN854_01380, partial [Mycoplasmatales bacterium]|nr:hypothetical protein [Mycoplasmatales bacterium]
MLKKDLFNILVDNTGRKIFDVRSGLKFFRIKACIYSYNKIWKKGKSFIFLDFGLKEKGQEDIFKIHKFYNERLNNNFIFYNRFYNYLLGSSLGVNSVNSGKSKLLKDYFYISRYDLMQNHNEKYSGAIVDIFFKSNRLLIRPFYNKLFDLDRWVSDYYPLGFDKLNKQIVIINDFASYWGFYIDRGENIKIGLDYYKKFHQYWFCHLNNTKKKFIEFFENRLFKDFFNWEFDIFFLKINNVLKKNILNKFNIIFLLRVNILCIFFLYRLLSFMFSHIYVYNKEFLMGILLLKIFNINGGRLSLFFNNKLKFFINVYVYRWARLRNKLKKRAFSGVKAIKDREMDEIVRQKFSYGVKRISYKLKKNTKIYDRNYNSRFYYNRDRGRHDRNVFKGFNRNFNRGLNGKFSRGGYIRDLNRGKVYYGAFNKIYYQKVKGFRGLKGKFLNRGKFYNDFNHNFYKFLDKGPNKGKFDLDSNKDFYKKFYKGDKKFNKGILNNRNFYKGFVRNSISHKIPIWNCNLYLASFHLNMKILYKKILKNFSYFIIFLYKRYFLYPIIGLCEKIVLHSFFWMKNFFIIKRFFRIFYYKFSNKIKRNNNNRHKKIKYKKILKIKKKINELIPSFLKVNKLVNLDNNLINLNKLKKKLLF